MQSLPRQGLLLYRCMFRQAPLRWCSSGCDLLIACEFLSAGRIHPDRLLMLWANSTGMAWAPLAPAELHIAILALILPRRLVNTAIMIGCMLSGIRFSAVSVSSVINSVCSKLMQEAVPSVTVLNGCMPAGHCYSCSASSQNSA